MEPIKMMQPPLISLDDAVAQRLEALAERERIAQMEREANERQLLNLRSRFAEKLRRHIAQVYGVDIPQSLLDSMEYNPNIGFRLVASFDAGDKSPDAGTVEGTIFMVRFADVDEFVAAELNGYTVTLEWGGSRRHGNHSVDVHHCTHFVEAYTFALTGKR